MRISQTKLSVLFSFWCLCGLASAQDTRGYVFAAPGAISAAGNSQRTYQLGGGLERLLDRGIGAGAELRAVVPGSGAARNSVGIFSLNGYYHFLRDGKLDPFATAGYSLLFRDFTANMFNYGGGLNYWFQDNLGIWLEIRDHVRSGSPGPAPHYWGIGIGLTFR
jgi:hypothetical protein